MATLDQHITARNDVDLLARVIAAAEKAAIPGSRQWAEMNMGAVVSVNIGTTAQASTVADVHAYAVSTYTPTPTPGANPASVTDAQIVAAVAAIKAAPAV